MAILIGPMHKVSMGVVTNAKNRLFFMGKVGFLRLKNIHKCSDKPLILFIFFLLGVKTLP